MHMTISMIIYSVTVIESGDQAAGLKQGLKIFLITLQKFDTISE